MRNKAVDVTININIHISLPPDKGRRQPRKIQQPDRGNGDVVADAKTCKRESKAVSKTGAPTKTNTRNQSGASSIPTVAKQQHSKLMPKATIKVEDSKDPYSVVSGSFEQLKVDTGRPAYAGLQWKSPGTTTSQEPPTAAASVENKPLNSASVDAPKEKTRKCFKCLKHHGVKLKRCALCVQKKKGPAYYCSRQCQIEDWEDHHKVHLDDCDKL